MIRLPHTRPSPYNEDNLIPLINIVFLMLIFFMVAGQIQSRDGLAIDPPFADNKPVSDTETRTLAIMADGQMVIDGKTLAPSELKTYLASLNKPAATNAEPPVLMIKADRLLPAAKLHATLVDVREAGFTTIRLLTLSGEPS